MAEVLHLAQRLPPVVTLAGDPLAVTAFAAALVFALGQSVLDAQGELQIGQVSNLPGQVQQVFTAFFLVVQHVALPG